jgi:hypothetical protein
MLDSLTNCLLEQLLGRGPWYAKGSRFMPYVLQWRCNINCCASPAELKAAELCEAFSWLKRLYPLLKRKGADGELHSVWKRHVFFAGTDSCIIRLALSRRVSDIIQMERRACEVNKCPFSSLLKGNGKNGGSGSEQQHGVGYGVCILLLGPETLRRLWLRQGSGSSSTYELIPTLRPGREKSLSEDVSGHNYLLDSSESPPLRDGYMLLGGPNFWTVLSAKEKVGAGRQVWQQGAMTLQQLANAYVPR